MQSKTIIQDGVAVVKITGDVDASCADEMTAALDAPLKDKHVNIVLDCSELRYISSAGLRSLLGTMKAAKSSSGELVLASVNEDVKRVLQLSGFTKLLRLESDVDTAAKSFN